MHRSLTGMALVLVITIIPASVSAHVLKIDGEIGATLHINPDDNPVAGEPTDYILSIEDSTNRFTLANCDCNVAFINKGATIDVKALNATAKRISENQYTFPETGVYTVQVSGKPKVNESFQPFTLNYEVRVGSGQLAERSVPILVWIGLAMTVGLILLAAYAMNYNDRDMSSKGNK